MPALRPINTPRTRLLTTALIAALLWLDYVPLAYSSRSGDARPSLAAAPGVQERLAAQRGRPCDLIFIGASNVEYWGSSGREVWDRFYAPRHAFNFGVAGDTTDTALWRLGHTHFQGLRPKVGVVFVGLNNLTDSPNYVALGVTAVAEKTRSLFPGIHVIVVSLTPNGRNDAQVVKTNKLLKALAAQHGFSYIDLYSHLPRMGPGWKGLCADRLHFNEDGYEIWAEQMEPLMQQFLPLDPAPRPRLAATSPAR